MATISENLQTLATAKANIKSAIEGKGQDLTDVPFTEYADKISAIQSGGGTDRLQWKCDNVKSLEREFYNYKGTDLSILQGLDTSEVTTMQMAFYSCSNVTTLPHFDTSKATNMQQVCSGCKSLNTLPSWDLSKAINLSNAFNACSGLTEVSELNVASAENLQNLFSNCSGLKTVSFSNTSSSTNFSQMLYWCTSLTDVIGLDTSKATSLSSLFQGDSKLTYISQLDTSSATNLQGLFNSCRELPSIPPLDTSKATNMSFAFTSAGIISLPAMNTKNVTNFTQMCFSCTYLKEVLGLDFINGGTTINMVFSSCGKLETLILYNIKNALILSSCPLLTNSSLLHTAQELWDLTGSTSQKLSLATASKTAIQGIYVKLVDVTDEMIANDQYITNKKPCVECASTDEGAMTLEEYILSKNWTIG